MNRNVVRAKKNPKKIVSLEEFRKGYFDQFNKQGYPPSVKQLEKKFGLSRSTVSKKLRELEKEKKISLSIGRLKDKKLVHLSPDEYSALMFAQKYLQKTGKKADPELIREVFGVRRIERFLGGLKNKIGKSQFKELFSFRSKVRVKSELSEYRNWVEKQKREELDEQERNKQKLG